MLKLMKYELIKQKTSKLILVSLLILLEAVFLIGVFADKEDLWTGASVFLVFLVFAVFLVIEFEAVFTYYHDLRDKSGYMLFMTPHSVYEIMGSKILTSIFSFLIAAALLALIGFLDFVFIFSKYGELEFLLKEIFGALSEVFSIDLSWGAIITEIIQAVFGWIGVLTSGFLAVTLCMTLISAVRGKGILCCVAYVLINLAFDFFSNNITDMANLQGELAQMILLAVLTVIYAGACFFFSCHILKRELSL